MVRIPPSPKPPERPNLLETAKHLHGLRSLASFDDVTTRCWRGANARAETPTGVRGSAEARE